MWLRLLILANAQWRCPLRDLDGVRLDWRGKRTLLPWNVHGRLSPKEVGMSLRKYEVVIILDPELEERTVAPSLEAFLNVIRADGGSVDNLDIWGRRRLAYDIDKKSEAIYVIAEIQATAAAVAEMDRQLNLNEAVMRTKVLRRDAA